MQDKEMDALAAATAGTEIVNEMEMYFEVRGEGEPLVLLHGGGGCGSNWNLVFTERPVGFRLIVPDLRGHGSSVNPSPGLTIRQVAQDVFALMDRLGIERFKAIGLSLGAKALLHLSTMQPQRVAAQVLVSAAPYFPAQARSLMDQLTPESRSEAEWDQMRQWHKHGDDQIRKLWNNLRALKDSYDDVNFTPPYLSTITARTLIVHGDRDPLYPVGLAVEMYNAIPNAFLWVLPNAGHGPIFGDATSAFVETALSFLRSDW